LATRAGIIGTEDDGTYDDGIIKTLIVPRGTSSGPFTFTFEEQYGVDLNNVPKGTQQLNFIANATLKPPVQYSFWRVDATGEVLVKDWGSNTFTWTPARVGEYTIQCRARGEGAGSYESTRTLFVNVTDTVDKKAAVTDITVNSAELTANAQAKKPIAIEANAFATNGENLLYKFMIYDTDMLTQELQGYSVNQHCLWTPREAGTYTISVLVKSDASFGQYDAIKSVDVTVS